MTTVGERRRPSRTPAVLTATQAAALIKSGDNVLVAGSSGSPRDVLRALDERTSELRGVTLIAGVLNGVSDVISPVPGSLRFLTWMSAPRDGSVRDDAIDVLPLSWFRAIDVLARWSIDVAVVQVTPADEDGFHSLGVSVSYTSPLLRDARLVIAEVNPRMPRTLGNSLVHESELDVVVEVDRPLPEFSIGDAGDDGRKIAELVDAIVPGGTTLQIGVGSLPAEAALRLARRGDDFNVYSFLSDASARLIQASPGDTSNGVPRALIGEVSGSQWLYDYVDRNPRIFMEPAPRIHSQQALHSIAPMIGINAALQVDLYGQINSEYLNGQRVSGIGGALDFLISTYDDANRVLVLLRSTSRGVSGIVPRLSEPASVGRALAPTVVTEWGWVDLRDLTIDQRAAALIDIAHPDHRKDLRQAWSVMVH